ncbi:MAG: 50S ribosomal protein L18Ae [Candidatus Bathyarchaeota archaeon]|nr:50S ribosomal protein L18a [Candidatus Bathyarchaeota archaeon A05DMB-3]MDH7606381.1 50S ribosomal protein L18Ae [Candidatus Bathyarchaeota archaeon]
MSEVKVFRVMGEIQKPNLKTPFRKEVIAVKPEHAVEKVYTELGSRHRVKRFHIKISKVEEVAPQDIEDPLIRKIVVGEEKIGEQS